MALSLRHQARMLAMQALYEWDIAQHDPFTALDRLVRTRDASHRAAEFAHEIVSRVVDHQEAIDQRITAAASNRPLNQMARVEKAILRLAISEILFNNAVPARAAINEAVELAKEYGGENSGRFVNGVLGTIFNQIDPSSTPPHQPESEETP